MAHEGDPQTSERVPISTGVPAKMAVGFNYPWSHELYGRQIGPDPGAFESKDGGPDWFAQFQEQQKLVDAGRYKEPDVPLPALFRQLKRNLTRLKTMGFRVVRFFLLGNFYSYGFVGKKRSRQIPGEIVLDYEFDPPAKPDPRYAYHFEEMLKIFKEVGMLMIPVFGDFPIAGNYDGDNHWRRHAGRRADCLLVPRKRDLLLGLMSELVGVGAKKEYEGVILAWDVFNEPVWLTFPWLGHQKPPPFIVHPEAGDALLHIGVMSEKSLIQFLEQALGIVKGRLKSTVGHRFHKDLSTYPKGDIPQFHYYAQRYSVMVPGRPSIDIADPPRIPRLDPSNPAFLGEFAVKRSTHPEWPDSDPDLQSYSNASTLDRLNLVQAKGYGLALVWNQSKIRQKFKRDGTPILDPKGNPVTKMEDWIGLDNRTRADIVKFTGGTLVRREDEEEKDPDEL